MAVLLSRRNQKTEAAEIEVVDNGGKTADRYTVRIGDSVFTMSDDASMPNGVNMYAGEIDEFKGNSIKGMGKPVAIRDLPDSVKRAINRRQEDLSLS